MLTPARRRGFEYLDDPAIEPGLPTRSLRDVARANRFFGGARAVMREVAPLVADAAREGRPLLLLDVGTGVGDIPGRARRLAARAGARLVAVGLDAAHELARAARDDGGVDLGLCGDALRLPLADRSVDVATCSQLLHHFERDDAVRLLAELHRVARVAVVVADLRRSWLAAGGIWIASWPLGFHPISRHDGFTSVLRGFTARELAAMVRDATGARARVRHRLGWRVVASWSPAAADPAPHPS